MFWGIMGVEKVFTKELVDFGYVQIGNLKIHLVLTDVVVTTWIAMAVVIILSLFFTRNLKIKNPSIRQVLIETVIVAMARQIRDFSNMPVSPFFNLIATMWIFVAFSNLMGMVPGSHTPTGNLSAVVGLSTITFFSVFYYGIKFHGFSYLKRFFEPIFILFPLNIIGEIGRIISLTFRLFGNMLGWDLIIAILVLLTGILVPVPMMLFNIVGDLIQTYLFGVLTLAYIVAGLKVEELHKKLLYLKENWYDL
ncbi:F0F1 ATP synthase subunit A [Venenivibrio stagnispumantis]|uniref:ATP synthase subunit a n=1 Tax=Venenivibrio stagnispumantis TaxID=407998 RepID=A0AA45WKW2_9AQUI|nr:F0F1 ATP synthase subunit A [Venenivibrio stagnispumantis]SMP08605.1 ATP synthase F0 subcomplex A subunit [Venenivibrio stagnispumantis]